MSACACMGPVGDCPCIRRQRGLEVKITEAYISPAAWEYLTPAEQTLINELKLRAAMRSVFGQPKEST